MSVQKQTATVFYAPTRGRRYFRRDSAISAEALAIIKLRYPDEPADMDTSYAGYDVRIDDPIRFEVMHRRMCRIIRAIK